MRAGRGGRLARIRLFGGRRRRYGWITCAYTGIAHAVADKALNRARIIHRGQGLCGTWAAVARQALVGTAPHGPRCVDCQARITPEMSELAGT